MREVIIILLAFVIMLLLLSLFFSNLVIKPRTHGYDETYLMEIAAGKIEKDVFESLPREEIYIMSPFGYTLHGLFFPSPGSSKSIIICHGITYTLFGSIKYMGIFARRGFNILVYDHRNHGKSGGRNTTFGFYEKYDLKAWADWLTGRIGPECIFGVHGESLGAAVAIQYSAMDPRVSFCIADCPFADLTELLKYRLKKDYSPLLLPMLYLSSFISKIRGAMLYSEVSPLKDIARIHAPMLFIHGMDDTYIPKQMSIDMHDLKEGIKMLYIAPNAGHAGAYWSNRDEYESRVGEFLDKIEI